MDHADRRNQTLRCLIVLYGTKKHLGSSELTDLSLVTERTAALVISRHMKNKKGTGNSQT